MKLALKPNIQHLRPKLESANLDILTEYIAYDESSPSCLRWLKRPCGNVFPGFVAGSLDSRGYWSVSLKGIRYKGHHVVMLLHGSLPSPGDEVDHVDRNPSNNRISNLRWVSGAENARNRSHRSERVSEYSHVSWSKKMQKWRVQIQANGAQHHLGTFDDDYTAHLAAMEWFRAAGYDVSGVERRRLSCA